MEAQKKSWAADRDDVLFYYGEVGAIPQVLRFFQGALKPLSRRNPLGRAREAQLRLIAMKAMQSKVRLENCDLIIRVPEMYPLITAKTLAAMRFVLEEFEFDYLFRTNSSSYINIKHVQNFAAQMPRLLAYAGPPGRSDVDFASGTGILLSRDLLELVVEDDQLDVLEIDDVAIGRSVSRIRGVTYKLDMNRVAISSREELLCFGRQELEKVAVIRLKNPINRSKEAKLMRTVVDFF